MVSVDYLQYNVDKINFLWIIVWICLRREKLNVDSRERIL